MSSPTLRREQYAHEVAPHIGAKESTTSPVVSSISSRAGCRPAFGFLLGQWNGCTSYALRNLGLPSALGSTSAAVERGECRASDASDSTHPTVAPRSSPEDEGRHPDWKK